MTLNVRKVFDYCYQAIGGEDNEDVRQYLYERPEHVVRQEFFKEAVWAIWVGGKSRAAAKSFLDWPAARSLGGEFQEVATIDGNRFLTLVARLHERPIPQQALARWKAVQYIAKWLGNFKSDGDFCNTVFHGKSATKDLDNSDLKTIVDLELPWVRTANAQLILRNIGGEFIKCDRWLTEFMVYGRMPLSTLERQVRALGIPLGLFDLTIWAYCEKFVNEVDNLKSHFDGLSTQHGFWV